MIGQSHGKLGCFSQHTTKFAMAVTNHSALSSYKIRSDEMRWVIWTLLKMTYQGLKYVMTDDSEERWTSEPESLTLGYCHQCP